MIYKKFQKDDVFFNTLKTNPSYSFMLGKYKNISLGNNDKLYNLNLGNNHTASVEKDGSGFYLGSDTSNNYNIQSVGKNFDIKYPFKANIDVYHFLQDNRKELEKASDRLRIYSLQNYLEKKIIKSPHFAFTSSLYDKSSEALCLIDIPSIFYGSAIEKGTLELGFYITGTLAAQLKDSNLNGELVETIGSNKGLVAGVVLHEQGIVILTGSWALCNFSEIYKYKPTTQTDSPRWIHWGAGLNQATNLTEDSSYSIKFNGKNNIYTLTMLAHAEKGEFNHSNNLTYLKHDELDNYVEYISTANTYAEPEFVKIKNTVRYPYENFSGSLEKQTFITKVNIYDENKNLIGVAKLAKPVKKTENRNFTFKLKLDI